MSMIRIRAFQQIEHLFTVQRLLTASEHHLADRDPDASLKVSRISEHLYRAATLWLHDAEDEESDHAHTGEINECFSKAIHIMSVLKTNDDARLIMGLLPEILNLRSEYREFDKHQDIPLQGGMFDFGLATHSPHTTHLM